LHIYAGVLLWILRDEARVCTPSIADAYNANCIEATPDALSKTIPIWCSVLNRLLFSEQSEYHGLYTPPQIVSPSEHAQISALLPKFFESLQSLQISTTALKGYISKPLRPIWITPESQITQRKEIFTDYHPIICCTVSRRVGGGEISEGSYIQGAGDDTENWAHGLTPSIFWANGQILLSTPEKELPELIEMLVRRVAETGAGGGKARCVSPTAYIFITPLPAITAGKTGANTCTIALLPKVTDESTWWTTPTRLDVGVGSHKLGSRNLRAALPMIIEFAGRMLGHTLPEQECENDHHILVACETGTDISIGVALAILSLFFDGEGNILKGKRNTNIGKTFIRRRLTWLSTSIPDANPSRATLQSVNAFLMDRP